MLEDRDLEKIQGMIDASQEKLAGMIGREFLNIHGKFDGINRKFAEVDKRFDGVDERFDGVDKRLDGVDKRFDGVDKRFDAVETEIKEVRRELSMGFAGVGEELKHLRNRMECIETELVDHRKEHAAFDWELSEIKGIVQRLEGKLDSLTTREEFEAVERRVGRLEEAVFA